MTAASQAAGKQAYDEGVGQLARTLSQYRHVLPTLFENGDLTMPDGSDEAAYRKMATDLLEKKKTTLKNKQGQDVLVSVDPTDKDNLDARDSERGGAFKKALGVDNLNKLVSRRGAEAFSDAIEDAVEKNSSDIGFLKGASIMNALAGLMHWVFSGFSGGFAGLQQSIATVTAENIREDVESNLVRLRGEKPEMAPMLTNENIIKAGDGAYFATLEKAGFTSPDAPAQVAFADIKPFTMDTAKVEGIRNEIRETILRPEGQEDLATQISNTMVEEKRASFLSNRFGWVTGVTENGLRESGKKMAGVIAGSIADTVTDPRKAQALAAMDKEDYAKTVAEEVGNALSVQEHSLGFPKKLSDKSGDITYLENIKAEVRKGIEGNYDRLVMSSRIAATVGAPENVGEQALAAAQSAREAGITGGIKAESAQVQPVGGNQGQSASRG